MKVRGFHIAFHLSESHAPLRLHQLVSTLPTILPEHLVTPFNFYWGGSIYRGMKHEKTLYGLVQSFVATERGQAYTLGSNLSDQREQVIITVSSQLRYKVWLDLRSKWFRQAYPIKFRSGDILDKLDKEVLHWVTSTHRVNHPRSFTAANPSCNRFVINGR